MSGALGVLAAREDRVARLRRLQLAARAVHDHAPAGAVSRGARRATCSVSARADHVSARAGSVSARSHRVAAGAISAAAGVARPAAAWIAGRISAGGGAPGAGGRLFTTRAGERENHEAGEDASFHGRSLLYGKSALKEGASGDTEVHRAPRFGEPRARAVSLTRT